MIRLPMFNTVKAGSEFRYLASSGDVFVDYWDEPCYGGVELNTVPLAGLMSLYENGLVPKEVLFDYLEMVA